MKARLRYKNSKAINRINLFVFQLETSLCYVQLRIDKNKSIWISHQSLVLSRFIFDYFNCFSRVKIYYIRTIGNLSHELIAFG